MKLIIWALLFIAAQATPLNRTDENVFEDNIKEPNWRLIPDSDYKLHLVDINDVDTDIKPSFVAINDIVFRLFTILNPVTPQVIPIYNDAQLASSNFNSAHQVRIHIHGWTQGGPDTANAYRDAYLARGNFNVIAVDWGVGAQNPNYIVSRNHVAAVGGAVARFIDWLNLSAGVPFSAVTVLGHSLGAHAAGHTGKAVTRGILPVIVALDPAGPLFTLANPATRVHWTDAAYVTNLISDTRFLGFEHPVGHANFYFNWGSDQPGCEGEIGGVCSHAMPQWFMVESINPANIFGAIRCTGLEDIRNRNCAISGPSSRMGGEPVHNNGSPPGTVYFLATNPTSPFNQGPR